MGSAFSRAHCQSLIIIATLPWPSPLSVIIAVMITAMIVIMIVVITIVMI